jgi:hypothetical protein
MRGTRLNRQIAVTARGQPMRVCYMLADDGDASEILTQIFAECYARWGGMYTLIIPVIAGEIDHRYLAWLCWFDPDIVYSYCDLTEELVTRVDRLCMPAIGQRHDDVESGGRKPLWPLLKIDPVLSLSVLPALRVSRGNLSSRPALILDAYPAWDGDGFVADSFGIRRSSPGGTMVWPMDAQVRDYVAPLALTPSNAPPNRWNYPKAENEVTSETELLERLATDGTVVTMAQLASAFSLVNVSHNVHPWANSLNLGVGDSVADRISFWNGRLLNQRWQQEGLTALRVPAARLADEPFLRALADFIAHRNWITPGGQSGSGHVTIRSESVDLSRLVPLRECLLAAAHSQINVETIKSALDCVPDPGHLAQLQRWVAGSPTQFVSETKFMLDPPSPRHFTEIAPVPPVLRRGHWAVDVRIERHDGQSPFSNVSHWWQLPRRREMLRVFSEGTHSKINVDGELRLFRDINGASKELRLPKDDTDAIRHLFSGQACFSTRDLRREPKKQAYEFTMPGDKGRYLIGALELFGNLASAFRVLSDRYWQTTLIEMAAPAKNLVDAKREEMVRRLRNEVTRRIRTTRIDSDSDWDALAEAVAKTSSGT